jgi:predicted HicB family RNase H-like nuclease
MPRIGSVTLNMRISPDLKLVAQRAAEAERRTLTTLVEVALMEWLQRNGYWPKSGDRSRPTKRPR